jgi:hypothetical protein
VLNLANARVITAKLACATGASRDHVEEYATGASGVLNQGDGNHLQPKRPKSYVRSRITMLLDLRKEEL